jgi:hypothetical protein
VAITAKRRVGLRSPLQPAICSAESWKNNRTSVIRQRFGRIAMHAVGEERIIGAISITLPGFRQRVTGDTNGENIITQTLFPIRQHGTLAVAAFGPATMIFGRLTIDPRGYVSAKGQAAMTMGRITMPRMDGVVGGVIGVNTMAFFPIQQRADAFTNVYGAVAMTLKGMQQIPGYFGGMGGITVTPRLDNSIVQTLFPMRQSASGALLYNFGPAAMTMPRLAMRGDGYTNVFAAAAMSMRGFSTSPQATISGSLSFVYTGSIDGVMMRQFFIRGNILVVNDGAIQMTLFPPTQAVQGWGEAIGATSMRLFQITESGNLGEVQNGVIAQTMPRLVITGLMGMQSYGPAAMTLFPMRQALLGNLPKYGPIAMTFARFQMNMGGAITTNYNLTWDLTAQASLANGESGLNIAGRGIADVLIGLALQGTFR